MNSPINNFTPQRISNLLEDLASAELKLGFKNSLNIFEAAALGRQEVKHSRMLSFLINPTKGHCLRDEVIKKMVLAKHNFLETAFSDFKLKPTRLILDGLADLRVECEWRNVDVIAYSDSQRLVVVIENKIDAKESNKAGESQLSRYADIVEREQKFAGYVKLFMYLTVEGDEPSDSRWCSLMHEEVLGFVQEAFEHTTRSGGMTVEASFFVKNYIDFLRRNVVTNVELEEECKIIYERHKDLIDKIIEVAAASGGVSDFAADFAEKLGCEIYANRSGRFAYLPKELLHVLPDGTLERTWWSQQKPVIFFFYLDDKKKLKLIFQVGPMRDKVVRGKLINQLFNAFGRDLNRRVTDQYTVVMSEKISIEVEDDYLSKMEDLHVRFQQKIPLLINVLNEFDFTPEATK